MRIRELILGLLAAASLAVFAHSADNVAQASVRLTVAEGKRLIGNAVAEMPIVKAALKDGTVIITRGTTNTYVAEAILGKEIAHGAFVTGNIRPVKGEKKMPAKRSMADVVLVKGEAVDITLADAVKQLKPGDVVIKGANALDYANRTAGVLIGAPNSGTTGAFMPYVIAKKAHLVIPIGLEKQVTMPLNDLQLTMREPVESLNWTPSMFPLTGHIVTEIEAIKVLSGADAFQAAAGGIGGAEGGSWLVVRDTREKVQKALDAVKKAQGEPPFIE